jgi:hypothetical protein
LNLRFIVAATPPSPAKNEEPADGGFFVGKEIYFTGVASATPSNPWLRAGGRQARETEWGFSPPFINGFAAAMS